MTDPILSIRDLSVAVSLNQTQLTLVDQVSFDLGKGEIMGLVGESGSGKSMTCRALMRLLPGKHIKVTSGSAVLDNGEDLMQLSEAQMRKKRGSKIGMIFQNPSSHLDPVMTIGDQIIESVRHHENLSKAEARNKTIEILQQVGIPDPLQRLHNYPHEFSGGMRQRAMIAVALACDPEILIADEPTTALDVTVQAQILRLLLKLRDERGLSIIFITHDLGVVSQVCDQVAVMYGGRICERGPKRDIILNPYHPYTAGLIACQPSGIGGAGLVKTIPGQPPRSTAMPSGCSFHPRCDYADDRCRSDLPPLEMYRPDHMLACHHPLRDDLTKVAS